VNDDAAFEQLFRDTRTDLLAYILRRSQSAEDAADILADTYLIAWQKLDLLPTGEGRRLWLFGVARNLLFKGASRRRSGDRLLERLADELPSEHVEQTPVDEGRSYALRSALATLPEIDREILSMAAWEALTPKEIATVLKRSPNLVRVRLHRARSRLKRQLASEHGAELAAREGPEQNRPSRQQRRQALEGEEDAATYWRRSRAPG
jgi:RNA polymerase sigma-70 factor, ECF subfamily